MTQEKKKYLTKTISFGGSKMTLYGVDGNTWSSRLDELDLLQERFENGGRLPVDATKGKQPFVIRKNKFAKRAAEDEPPSLDDYDDAAVVIEDETIAGVVLDEELEEEGLEDEAPTIKALSKAAKKGAEVKKVIEAKKTANTKTVPSIQPSASAQPSSGTASGKRDTSKGLPPVKDKKVVKESSEASKKIGKDSNRPVTKHGAKSPAISSDKASKTAGKAVSSKTVGHSKVASKSKAPSGSKSKEVAKGKGGKKR